MAQRIRSFSWPGNKRLLAPIIIKNLPTHVCYVEPFGGALGVLLAKERSAAEVINDIDGDIIGFYRVVKYHLGPLIEELSLVPYSREEFQDYLRQPGLTDIQRAARWLLRNNMSFGALGSHFGTGKTRPAPSRVNLLRALEPLHDRLDKVYIENLDWRDVLQRYDAPGTVFFCDPPYATGQQKSYARQWDEKEHTALRDALLQIAGKFLLTYDDSPLIRELYAGHPVKEISQRMGINAKAGARKEMKQLLIASRRDGVAKLK